MKVYQLDEFTKGWLVGDFEPAIIKTEQFEFAIKYYQAGDHETKHLHKIGRELTVAVTGAYRLNDQIFKAGEAVDLPAGEAAEFECLESGATAVIKFPSVKDDKYIVE